MNEQHVKTTDDLKKEVRHRLSAYSDANRPPIPIQTGHLFRSKSAGDSDSNRPPLREG